MSSLAFLVTELQSLASETRRKHPEVREAAEKSLAILRSSPEQATANLASDGPQSDDLLRPVFMGCATKNAKVVAISLGSLQRLIALKAVPHSAVPVIINTMSDCINQGVDIQLRILQTLLSLITNFPAVHGELLGDALLLCFKLQESRIAVVSSTAAATLRQLVMFVVDKVVEEDRRNIPPEEEREETYLPNGSLKKLGPSARDTFAVFEDLCLLANSEKPLFLKLDFLHKTFALELIESVLTNYHDLFRKHPELILLLQHHLCPLLLKGLSERPLFPLTLRSTRVVFLLLKQFSSELETESEVFLMLLIKIISGSGGDSDMGSSLDSTPGHGSCPTWMRVLSMEIMRGLCSDSDLMRNVWDRYDAQDSGSKVFTSLMTALKRLITEKPALLGVESQMLGIGVSSTGDTSPTSYGLDVGVMAGMVATAASATMSGVVGMMGPGAGLSTQGSAMKLQCIDQLDKADSPPIPEAYIYLLAVQCLVSLCEGFASFTGPLYTSIMIQKPRTAGESVVRAPAALDLSQLPPDDTITKQLRIVQDMVASGWPALLAALSFIVSTNLSHDLFADVLASYQAMTNVSGMLALTTPRDAFLTSLAKFAVPTRVVSSLDSYGEPSTSRPTQSITENLGLTGPSQSPGLSERNLACLKVFVSSALFLAGSLGKSWFDVLEVLQNADYILTAKGAKLATKRSTLSPGNIPGGRSSSVPNTATAGGAASSSAATSQPLSQHPLLSDLDPESVQGAIQRLFDTSKSLEDPAFKDFVNALCKLSGEMVDMQSGEAGGSLVEGSTSESTQSLDVPTSPKGARLSPRIQMDQAHRRRVSGIHLPRTLRSGDFGINKLGGVALLNIHRLIYRSPEIAWNTITTHLLSIIRHATAPQHIRIQAARILDEILVVVPRNLTSTGEMKAEIQQRVLDVLSQQIIYDTATTANSTSVELRRMGLDTLHVILQSSGHTLVVGWENIFEMLGSVCRPATVPQTESTDSITSASSNETTRPKPPPLGYANEKGYTTLVKIAFQSLTLVCDSLTSFSPEHLRLCISTLGQFGRQADTNIALTAAESLLWGVSDSIQTKRKDAEKEPEYSALWMFLLLEVLGLCTDARPEVRVGAIQTLFRTLQLYGGTLSLGTWDECIWKVTFPLLDSITSVIRQNVPSSPSPDISANAGDSGSAWDESKSLALQSVGSIFNDFLVSKIIYLDSFPRAWDVFLGHVRESWLSDSRSITTPALRSLEKAIRAFATAGQDLKDRIVSSSERAWEVCDNMGGALSELENTRHPNPFTQESLVAFVDVIRCNREVSRKLQGSEWTLERLTRLMVILKGVLTYPYSPEYRPDIDALSPVQMVVMEIIHDFDLSTPGAPSLILRDLSEYATLPFLAAFDVQATYAATQKRVTYISLSKKAMPQLVELFLRFKTETEIYINGTLEAVLSAYSVPIKLKYDCPAPSKFGKDPPLWKTATAGFLQIVREFSAQLKSIEGDIPDDRIEGIWRQVLQVFRGGILADCSSIESLPHDVQEAEENFDLALIASLEIDVVPHLGDPRVPDYLIIQLAKVLHLGSKLRDYHESPPFSPSTPLKDGRGTARSSDSFEKIDVSWDRDYEVGTTGSGTSLPRERFSYWCFDLLFLICSDTAKDHESSRRRIASLSLPMLLSRCRTTLVGFIADEELRGTLPFSRSREEELLYVLRKLLSLQLWAGTLWAALSQSPSEYAVQQLPIDASLEPRELIADAVQRSSKAHLFHFYQVLCEMASIPRKPPSAWLKSLDSKGNGGDAPRSRVANEAFDVSNEVTEFDSRSLARECLRQIGKEMGISR